MPSVLSVLAVLVLGGCADELTQIVVVVDTDMRVPEDIDEVTFTVDVSAIDMRMSNRESEVDFVLHRPAVLGLVHEGGPLGPLTIVVVGRRRGSGSAVVTREAVVSFEQGRVRMLRMDLFAACEDAECRERDTTCGTADGSCVDLAHPLAEWPGRAIRLEDTHAPVSDGGGFGPDSAATDSGFDGGSGCSGSGAASCDRPVTAGDGHSCAVTSFGGVTCWGDNGSGELGDGSGSNHATPVSVVGLPGPSVLVSAGGAHSCALLSSGAIACWGDGGDGRLGDGEETTRREPVLVRSLGGAASWVSAGGKHTCAVVASEVRCWGSNSDGQLATDDDDSESSPAYADGVPRTATRVSAGQGHTCALVADGDVYCWGANSHGQIGVGPGFDDELRPSRVGLRRAALDVVAGGAHTCALLDDGTVLCWGDGRDGQLGHGGTSPRFSPAVVPGVLARSITVGARHTCALTATSAYCWGDNGARQLGNGSDMAESVLPSDVWGAAGITRISAGSRHTCSRRESGSISCWGTGDLGEGTTESNIPVTFTVP